MNARLVKLALTLCSISLLNLSALHAQDTNDEQVPQPPGYSNGAVPQPPGGFGGRRGPGGVGGGSMGITEESPTFDIQIENGELSLAPLADRSATTNFWAPDAKTVTANMNNISRYLRATDPHLSVVLSPGTGGVMISNLKIKTASLPQLSEAINIASGNTISGNGSRQRGFFGPGGRQQIGDSTLTFTSRESQTRSTVEVFNLSGYIQSLGKVSDDVVRKKLDELQGMIMSTMQDMRIYNSSADAPNFKYHSGTKLLIVIGKPEAIEVARKIINALSGQQTNGKTQDLMLDVTPPPSQN